ncbi:MAG: hypothetical protein M0P31_14000 [Solirubrobacteraceae bacterium]|nr:hypothetical protein [Solirubrobacteraceae bacterium]
MSADAPERVWLTQVPFIAEGSAAGRQTDGMAWAVGGVTPDRFPGDVEYVRGDLHAAVEAERDRLREVMLLCADKLGEFGNEEPGQVAAMLRSAARAALEDRR